MAEDRGESINNLLGEAFRDASDLARKEMALFRTEISENIRTLVTGLGMMVAAAVFAIAAIILFTQALVKWLAPIVGSEALSALIVGVVMAAGAVGLVLYGRSVMSATTLAPTRAVKSIQRDAEVLSESVTG
jgi:membrane glycosyltransferase